MRDDQIALLRELSEKLADVFIIEADPSNWTADGKLPNDMTREERGDRTWDRKGAMGTGGVLRTTLDILARHGEGDKPADGGDDADGSDLDAQIKDAERRASEAANRVLNKAQGKPELAKRAHGG